EHLTLANRKARPMTDRPLNLALRQLRRLADPAGASPASDAQLLHRYLTQRDETAFELLLRRHDRLVYGVCRRVLRDEHAAADAFQATFLTLVKKARSIRRQESLAGWLYRVAYRAALRAAVRLPVSCRADDLETVAGRSDPAEEAAWRDLRPLLDRE